MDIKPEKKLDAIIHLLSEVLAYQQTLADEITSLKAHLTGQDPAMEDRKYHLKKDAVALQIRQKLLEEFGDVDFDGLLSGDQKD